MSPHTHIAGCEEIINLGGKDRSDAMVMCDILKLNEKHIHTNKINLLKNVKIEQST